MIRFCKSLKIALPLLAISSAATCAQTTAPTTNSPPTAKLIVTEKIPIDLAINMAKTAMDFCAAQGHQATVTVVDSNGLLQVEIRNDKALAQTPEISFRKAYTAAIFGAAFSMDSTAEIIEKKPGGVDIHGLDTVDHVLFAGGGIALKKADGTVIGGIGTSGSPGGALDAQCSQAAVDKYKSQYQ